MPLNTEARSVPKISPEQLAAIMNEVRPHRPTERHGETLAFRIFMLGVWPLLIAMFLLLGWAR